MQKTVIQTLPNDAHLHTCSLLVIYSEASYIHTPANQLKGLAQAKIIQKSVILFWLLNMTI